VTPLGNSPDFAPAEDKKVPGSMKLLVTYIVTANFNEIYRIIFKDYAQLPRFLREKLDGAVDFLEQVIFLFRYLDNFLQQRVP
jgi:hypothetical protein